MEGPPVCVIEVMPLARAQATIWRPVGPSLTPPRPTSPMIVTTGFGQLAKIVLGEPGLEDQRAGDDLHAARAEGSEGPLGGDRQRLDADDVLRTSRIVCLTGRDHGGDAAVERGFDPTDLVLARGPVAGHRVHMVVDEARRDNAALGVDLAVDGTEFDRGSLADRADEAVLHEEGVGVEDRPVDIATQQQADVSDRKPAGDRAHAFWMCCHERLLSLELWMMGRTR